MGEEGGATAGHQVTQSQDGALPHSQTRAGQLTKQRGEQGGVETDQRTTQPVQRKERQCAWGKKAAGGRSESSEVTP